LRSLAEQIRRFVGHASVRVGLRSRKRLCWRWIWNSSFILHPSSFIPLENPLMSTRERWIVYPLLFLALGLALRDKVYPPSKFTARSVRAEEMLVDKVRCNHLDAGETECEVAKVARLDVNGLSVSDPKGKERARMGVMENESGQVELYGRDGKPVLIMGADKTGRDGFLQTVTAEGAPQVLLHSVNGWGRVTAVGPEESAACTMGSLGDNIAVFAELPQEKRIVPLSNVVPAPRPAAKPGPKGGAAKP
jgi:hypothetical protein